MVSDSHPYSSISFFLYFLCITRSASANVHNGQHVLWWRVGEEGRDRREKGGVFTRSYPVAATVTSSIRFTELCSLLTYCSLIHSLPYTALRFGF